MINRCLINSISVSLAPYWPLILSNEHSFLFASTLLRAQASQYLAQLCILTNKNADTIEIQLHFG